MKTIGIVPDNEPNADAKIVEIGHKVDLGGRWVEVEHRLVSGGFIPEGWHLVGLNDYRMPGSLTPAQKDVWCVLAQLRVNHGAPIHEYIEAALDKIKKVAAMTNVECAKVKAVALARGPKTHG